MDRIFQKVKHPGKITTVYAVFVIFVCTTFFNRGPVSFQKIVDNYYQKQLQNVSRKIAAFKIEVKKKQPVPLLRQQFYQNRIAYKKMAVITEYFNLYETKILNGPALERVESDLPDNIIPPQGFQAVEQILFSDWNADSYQQLNELLNEIQNTLVKLENEPDRIYKFREEMVWDAMRSATVQVITTGITGFDSPIAQQSLPEATSSIEGIKNLLRFFKPAIDTKSRSAFPVLLNSLNRASIYLQTHRDFNRFDRLIFVTDYINPFYKQLVKTRIIAGIGVPGGNNPVNFDAETIFSEDAFDINFYSPPKEFQITPERIELGKRLFLDPILSGTKTRSCASCHLPEKAFSDGLKTPLALNNETLLTRNTPTLINSALQTRQFYDSRTDILENQLEEVVHNVAEMKGSLKQSVADLQASSEYKQLFFQAYVNEKQPISAFNIANAISSYVRSLVALNSRFDLYMRGARTKLSPSEKRGFNLFAGKAKCATCHFIPLFNGLVPPVFTETESEVLGVPETKDKQPAVLDPDPGKFAFTKSIIHKNSFKTPSLRNVELTAPYMHNGVYTSLEEIMDFYNLGGGKGLGIAPSNQTLPFDKLNLSKKEITDIIAFMKTLTDTVTRKYR